VDFKPCIERWIELFKFDADLLGYCSVILSVKFRTHCWKLIPRILTESSWRVRCKSGSVCWFRQVNRPSLSRVKNASVILSRMFLTRFRAISASAVPPALGRGGYALFQSACLGNIAGDRIQPSSTLGGCPRQPLVRTIFTAVTIFKVARLCAGGKLIQFCQGCSSWMHKIQESSCSLCKSVFSQAKRLK